MSRKNQILRNHGLGRGGWLVGLVYWSRRGVPALSPAGSVHVEGTLNTVVEALTSTVVSLAYTPNVRYVGEKGLE